MSQIARVKEEHRPSETVQFATTPGTYDTVKFTEGNLGFIAQSVTQEESDRVAFEIPQDHSTTESIDHLLSLAGAPLNSVFEQATVADQQISFRGGKGTTYYAIGGEYNPAGELPVVLYARSTTETQLRNLISDFDAFVERLP